jgi:sugar O-acyltransferase (sialic acid O-acetyltransferase NeuD family)
MSSTVVVLGAGSHGAVVVDALQRMGLTVSAITDIDVLNHGASILGIPVIGDDEEVLKLNSATVSLILGVGIGTGDLREGLALRRAIYDRFVRAGYEFGKLIHPSAIVGANVGIASGAQIMAGVVIQTGARVGENCIINTRASVDHDCHIGAHSHIAPGAILGGGIEVGEAVHVSIGAMIAPNIKIGDGAVIAAGAIVIEDVPPHVTVYGLPAKEKNDL